ncbi:MAG: hypothetical protein Q4B97_03220 [Lachnospiraceae bacterium]|nr:hypothetical protein [Lachnospiraceae bacterium]
MKKYVKQAVGVCMAMLMAVSAGEYSGMIVQAAENQEAGGDIAPVYEAGNVAQKEDGTVYYWEYDSASFEGSAALGYYKPIVGETNKLMMQSLSGEKVMIGDMEGGGSLALTDGSLIFYEKPVDQIGGYEICSIDQNSGQTQTYGLGRIEASDGKKIICSDSTNYCIDSIDAETGERTKLVDGSFLASHDGLIYYQPVEADSGAATKGKVSLAVVDAQGGQQKTLCTTEPDLYADDFQGTASIVSMVFKDEYIYFSYGSYAGTGSVYAGGKIMKVKKDGTEAEVVAGMDGLRAPAFSVSEDGTVVSQSIDEMYDYINSMDKYFTRNGSIYFMNENGEPAELVTQADYASVGNVACGQFNDNEAVTIQFAEKIGNKVYMLLDYGVIDETSRVGWRTGYARVNSAMLSKDLDTGTVETVFSY